MKKDPKEPVAQPAEPAAQPIVQPMIDELVGKQVKPAATEPQRPQPAELDQDAGGGYNPDHTIPQE